MRTRSAARLTVVLAVAVLTAAAPSLAAAAPPTWQVALDRVERLAAPVRAEVSAIRSLSADGTVFSSVRAVALAAHHSNAVRGVRTPRTPATGAQAARTISAAVRRATAIVRASAATRWGERLGMRRVAAMLWRLRFAPRSTSRRFHAPSSGPALHAAAIVARAVDASMPALRRAAAHTASPSAPVQGCDVVDQTPNLCIGGTGDNTYTKDEIVQIDLGGNDTYRNSAAGVPDSTNVPLAVLVDLTGDDTYASPASDFAVQGAGGVGGVGILVDGAGDDTYTGTSNGNRAGHFGVVTITGGSQGQGEGSGGGAGFLLDGAGDDSYLLTATATGAQAGASGQGEGFFGGAAGFVDGGGDDTYTLHTLALPKAVTLTDDNGNEIPVTQYGSSGTGGQGVGFFAGTAIFVDGGGTDSITDAAELAPSPPDAPPVYMPGAAPNLPQVGSSAEGIGVFGGAAFAIFGPGTTTSVLTSTAASVPTQEGGVISNVSGQGDGAFAGLGVLSDAGGDDTYDMRASSAASVAAAPTDACPDCGGELDAAVGATGAIGQGNGSLGALGLLDDTGGNDTYAISASNTVSLTVNDQRTAPATPYSGAAGAGLVTTQVQGYGSSGNGFLLDVGGDDRYSAASATASSQSGSAAVAANLPALRTENAGVVHDAQGATALGGPNAIVDLGGSDSYRSTVSSTRTDDGTQRAEPVAQTAQGGVDANGAGLSLAIDLDGIGTDTYATTPADQACQGVRGQAVWMDCGTVGIGVNA